MTGTDDVKFDGRRDERFEASWLIEIAHPSQGKVRVSAKDVSATGARLAVPANIDLPETFAFRIVGKNFVAQARMVWRRGHYVGVVVERTAPLPVPSAVAPKVQSLGPEARKDETVRMGTRGFKDFRERHGL